jgi:hypothetical protein
MRLKIIQFSPYSLYTIYAFQNFLPPEEHVALNSLVDEITVADEMNKSTNVQANMTTYNRLNDDLKCAKLFDDIFYTLDGIFRLRGKSIEGYKYSMKNSWAMRHKPDDFTLNHNHMPGHWSGVYYTYVPEPRPTIDFLEFNNDTITPENNMLVLFPSMVFHKVSKNKSQEDRLSIAFNIDVDTTGLKKND